MLISVLSDKAVLVGVYQFTSNVLLNYSTLKYSLHKDVLQVSFLNLKKNNMAFNRDVFCSYNGLFLKVFLPLISIRTDSNFIEAVNIFLSGVAKMMAA